MLDVHPGGQQQAAGRNEIFRVALRAELEIVAVRQVRAAQADLAAEAGERPQAVRRGESLGERLVGAALLPGQRALENRAAAARRERPIKREIS